MSSPVGLASLPDRQDRARLCLRLRALYCLKELKMERLLRVVWDDDVLGEVLRDRPPRLHPEVPGAWLDAAESAGRLKVKPRRQSR